ncbi:uncharacterized protein PHACADRAFT_28838 [Phanerochaete carnosa HHB-10118-sp]|uniref:Uncharacterized protein n=1 Tax=Phanerochaete carnosa (strain HHB-10118-sp) TaxID=650164 RepID=K5WZC3_PHACS|nr:uncharacterized protein PHACADRAFT_28838 [Phanerochaete carnosa HHB-10118-sp]EKM55832.1 hypothetical protein PHACADRAFT_28838 [Phanerochaete carnosa HHB-10118-sp]
MQYYAMPIHMLAPEAPPFIPFSNLNSRPDLISLEDARRDPAIVYGSFDRLTRTPPVPRRERKPSTSSVSSVSAGSSAGSPSPSHKKPSHKLHPVHFRGKWGIVPVNATEARCDSQCPADDDCESSLAEPLRENQHSSVRDNWF